eukprot:365391-Chlamydomonas_euryale.AAC.4
MPHSAVSCRSATGTGTGICACLQHSALQLARRLLHYIAFSSCMCCKQAVAPVTKVSVSHSNGLHELAPSINGVVKKLDMHVGSNGQLEQGV